MLSNAKDLYGVRYVPTTIFIDRQGKVRYHEGGSPDEFPPLADAVVNELLDRVAN